jgi:hypothetical protein
MNIETTEVRISILKNAFCIGTHFQFCYVKESYVLS